MPDIPKGYKQTEVGVIPEDWDLKPVGEIGSVRMCKRVLKHQTHDHGDVPFYKIGTFGGVPDAFIPQSLFDDFRRRYSFPRTGDVLISAAGTIGKTVIYDGAPAYFQDSNIVWIENDESKATNAYLAHRYQVTKWSVSHGGTVARLYNDSLRTKIHIPLPPLPEQCAIAAALSDVDALLAGLDRLVAKKRDLKQAAMQQLLTGQTRLIGFDGEWRTVKFIDLTSPGHGRIDPSRCAPHEFCVELEHIDQGTGRLLGWSATTPQSSLKSTFDTGDVLFGKLRAYLRKYWLANRPGVCSTEIWVLKPNPESVTSGYLYQLVTMDRFVDAASTAYGTHMPRSDWKVVRELELLVPLREEQDAIAAVLSDMDAEIEALEQRRAKTADLKQAMMQELLTGRIRLV